MNGGGIAVRSVVPVDETYNSICLQARLLSDAVGRHMAVASDIGRPPAALGVRRDVLLYHYGAFDSWIFAFALRRRTIFVFHNVTPPELLLRSSLLVAARALLARIQLRLLPKRMPWIAVSRDNLRVLRSFGFQDVQYVPCIVKRTAPQRKSAEPTLLFVGRICPSKNVVELLRAHREVVRRSAARVRLVVIGMRKERCRYADEFERELASSREAGLDVVWRSSVPYRELQRLYAEAWVYVSASLHEGFGIPVVEAVMAGTPAVYLQCGGTETVMEHRGCCGAETKGLAETVVELISSAQSRAWLLEAQQSVCAEFSPEAVGRKLYRYLSERFAPFETPRRSRAVGFEPWNTSTRSSD